MRGEIKLCLGSAQFGSNYGVTNKNGKLTIETIKSIISFCYSNNIDTIDTAQDYGDAEKLIGESYVNPKNFKINSKLKTFNKEIFNKEDMKVWQLNLEQSLKRLKIDSLECLFLHNEKDIKKKGSSYLFEWLEKNRTKGLIKNYGISIYDNNNISEFLGNNIKTIQLPLSIYDRKNKESGFLNKLHDNSFEIYARSIYLQGLILNNSVNWPKWVCKEDLENHNQFLKNIKNLNISPLEASIYYIKSISELSSVIIGVTSLNELRALIKVWNKDFDKSIFKEFKLPNFSKNLLDPRKWPKN